MNGISEQDIRLVNVAQEIGGIADMAPWAVAGLSAMIEASGKAIEDLTVGEMLEMNREHDNLQAEIEIAWAKSMRIPVRCRDLECESREVCPHSQEHEPNEECPHVCGADEPYSRCFPVKEDANG